MSERRHYVTMPKVLRPEDLVLVADTREQLELDLPHFPVVRKALWVGDYSVVGLETLCVCERKSLPDYISCCGSARNHFEDQLRRLLSIPVRCVVCEFAFSDLQAGEWRGQLPPSVAMGTAASWMSRGVPFAFCGSRQGAATFVEGFLWSAARHKHAEILAFAEKVERKGESWMA